MGKLFTALFFAVVLTFNISAQASFLPQELKLSEKDVPPGPSNITEDQFNQIINDLQNMYRPLATQFGGNLNILGEWNSDQIVANSNQTFGLWLTRISGALARRPELIPDGLTLILCHELGHHFGGFAFMPNSPPIGAEWAAAEGQADYYSTAVCARKIWANDTQINAQAGGQVSAVAKKSCDAVYPAQGDRDICYRANIAVQSIMNTMAALLQQPPPNLSTPDTSVVDKTFTDHPAIQCRLDTVYQGSICSAKFNDQLIPGKTVSAGVDSMDAEKEAAQTSCMQSSGFTVGLRPACWFKARL